MKLPAENRDEVLGREVGLLFPAKLYCGRSLLDDRRESIIIDYADNDQIDRYIDKVDKLVGRKGLQIRDEICMVRPGLYLGRAYFGTIFGLNFVLHNEDVETREGPDFQSRGGVIQEECAAG